MSKQHSHEDIQFWRVAGWEQIEVIRGRSVRRDCPRHWHEEIHICFIEAGGGTLFYRGTNHQTPPGSLFIVEPGETHGNYTRSLTGCNYRTLNITPEIFHRLIFEITESAKFPFSMKAPIVFDADLIQVFTNTYKTFEFTSSDLQRDSFLLEFFGRLITRYAEKKPRLTKANNERTAIKRAREYLHENLSENVLLSDLSQIANLSPFHFNRAFAVETGLPPHAYQTQLRINHAKRLLQSGESLSSIASTLGFADQSHFNRHFKRIVGTTPGQYVQTARTFKTRPVLFI